jgi:hypothetical protein
MFPSAEEATADQSPVGVLVDPHVAPESPEV